MTAVLSGTNGLLQSYDYQVLTTGFSYTFAAGVQVLVINPAGTLATGTITMPASPSDGMTITVESTQQVTAITVNANTGQSIVGAASQLIPNQSLSWIYRLANTTWYPFFGGAGRGSFLVSGTAQATTSGTSIDFTGIPSWVKRITVMFNGVSTNGTSLIQVQIGDSGGIETTSYSSGAWTANTTNANSTAGFIIHAANASAARVWDGAYTIVLQDTASSWIFTGMCNSLNDNAQSIGIGRKQLSPGPLDRIRITTVNGTDTFDLGSVNIFYE